MIRTKRITEGLLIVALELLIGGIEGIPHIRDPLSDRVTSSIHESLCFCLSILEECLLLTIGLLDHIEDRLFARLALCLEGSYLRLDLRDKSTDETLDLRLQAVKILHFTQMFIEHLFRGIERITMDIDNGIEEIFRPRT